MNAEVNLFGVYVPGLLVIGVIAVVVTALLTRLLGMVDAYRFVANRPLIDVALFVIVLGGLVLLLSPETLAP